MTGAETEITAIRPVLLSAPYADEESLSVRSWLKSGYRTCGLVEVTLADGTVGYGEGYLAVFAPHVFETIVDLVAPYLVGRDAGDVGQRYRELCRVTGYWSQRGAARHVVGACEAAMIDAVGKQLGVPAYRLLGGRRVDELPLYGSGGDSTTPAAMGAELDSLADLGIGTFKIRGRREEVDKAVWTMEAAAERGIETAVDMTQNLERPAQRVADAVRFVEDVHARTDERMAFLEEALGLDDLADFRLLREKLDTKVAGGETVTTAAELVRRVERGLYDIVQPDATVIGGVHQTMEVFSAGRTHGTDVVVHCWGGAPCMAANYHAALAGGGRLAEWPMPEFPLREAMLVEPFEIVDGRLQPPTTPGLGVELTDEVEERYPFREGAVYECLRDVELPDAAVWRD
jgi:L-alanine-DL-glutamate epimerase-like enolase superfamily enzyme